MKLAVIIPYYNGEEYIDRCLRSLEKDSACDIYIVDNSESPIRNDLDAIVITTIEKKIGFGAAVNFGVSQLPENQYTHILILNQDAFFQSGHFSKLVHYLQENNVDKFLSPMIYREDFYEIMPFVAERYFSKIPNAVIDIQDFVAVSLVVPLTLFNKLDGFDTDFYMYYEDTDLIKRAGIPMAVRILPYIHVAHRNDELTGKAMNKEKQKWLKESKLLYLKKHESYRSWAWEKIKSILR